MLLAQAGRQARSQPAAAGSLSAVITGASENLLLTSSLQEFTAEFAATFLSLPMVG